GAHERDEALHPRTARQEPEILIVLQRAEHDAELALAVPDARTERGPASERTVGRRISQLPERILRKIEPLTDELHYSRRKIVVVGDHRLEILGALVLRGEPPHEVQFHLVGERVAFAHRVGPEPDQGTNVGGEPILLGPIETDRRLGRGPGAVEEAQEAVMEDVREPAEAGIAIRAEPLVRVVGEMQRKRPVGTEDAEEVDPETGNGAAVSPGRETGQRGRSE